MTYNGTADITIREHYLVATFGSRYFYVNSTDCLCIPVSLRCNDTAGDVWQRFNLRDGYNDHRISIDSLCLHKPYNTVVSVPRSELINAQHPTVIEMDASCSVCDAYQPGKIELAVSRPSELTDLENAARALSAYRSLEFSEFWEIWCAKRYDGDARITPLLFERIRAMDSVYLGLYGADYIFLWRGNGFCAQHRYLDAAYRLENLYRCTSRQLTTHEDADLVDDENPLVASILCEPLTQMSESVPPENREISWGMIPRDNNPTRYLVHEANWSDEGTQRPSYFEIEIEGYSFSSDRVVMVIFQSPDTYSSATDCPHCSEGCAPWISKPRRSQHQHQLYAPNSSDRPSLWST